MGGFQHLVPVLVTQHWGGKKPQKSSQWHMQQYAFVSRALWVIRDLTDPGWAQLFDSAKAAVAQWLCYSLQVSGPLSGFALHASHPVLLRQQVSWSLFFWWQRQKRVNPSMQALFKPLLVSVYWHPIGKESHMANPSIDKEGHSIHDEATASVWM